MLIYKVLILCILVRREHFLQIIIVHEELFMEEKNIRNNEEMEIDLQRVFSVLLSKAWLIGLVTAIFLVGAYLYSALFITPTYRSDFTAYVDNRITTNETNGSTTTSDLNASIYLTYLYEDIILSRSVLNDAAAKCNLNIAYKSLRNMVTTSVADDAALITVSVVADDPVVAQDLAVAIAEVAPAHVSRMKEGSSMRILDAPLLPTSKYAPSNTKNAMLGAVIGFVLITVAVLAGDLINDIVRGADELERRYNVVVIGTIPDLSSAEKNPENYGYAYGKAAKK